MGEFRQRNGFFPNVGERGQVRESLISLAEARGSSFVSLRTSLPSSNSGQAYLHPWDVGAPGMKDIAWGHEATKGGYSFLIGGGAWESNPPRTPCRAPHWI